MGNEKDRKLRFSYNISIIVFACLIILFLAAMLSGSITLLIIAVILLFIYTPILFKNKFRYYKSLSDNIRDFMRRSKI